jgi:hypothetical protein
MNAAAQKLREPRLTRFQAQALCRAPKTHSSPSSSRSKTSTNDHALACRRSGLLEIAFAKPTFLTPTE